MRIEIIPLIIGVLMGLIGLALIIDAWTADEMMLVPERRRRQRAERHRAGEAMLGFGVLAMAAAFIGRDTWRYSILAVIIGTVLLLVGTVLNRRYLRELFTFRGALRRGEGGEASAPYAIPDRAHNRATDSPQQPPEPPSEGKHLRIR